MIPLLLSLTWPPFAAISFRHRSERAAALAGGVAAAGCLSAGIVWDSLPAIAASAVWLMIAAASLLVARPAYPSRREQRRHALQQETAWGQAFDEAREELDSADQLVPVLLRAPRRVR
jgi:hypothetical protein